MNELKNLNRISIVGGPGTGKTTLAYNLAKEYDLPICHLDAIQNLNGWKKRDKKERDEIILSKINEDKWIIDGTYKTTLEARIEKSDLIIFLNYSTIARLRGIILRYFKNRGKEKAEIPGCKEQMSIRFVRIAINWDKEKEKIVKDLLERHKDKRIVVFKNQKQLNKWYKMNFNKRIKY